LIVNNISEILVKFKKYKELHITMNQKNINSFSNSKPTVLVVGGAGFIGSYVNKTLHRAGYPTVVLDNLSRGSRESVQYGTFIEGDISDKNLLKTIFERHSIDVVMHFAAYIDVGESVQNPAKYYANNVMATFHLLDAMVENGVYSFVFSSTAAIFGLPQTSLMAEDHPCDPINPYGKTKWMIEKMMEDYACAYGLRYCCFRYFNAAGGDPEGKINHKQRNASNLIPKIFESLQKGVEVTVYGTDYPTPDGTCIRDYIHIADLATAHILGMERLLAGSPSMNFNLGNGKGYSVNEVVSMTRKVLKTDIPIRFGARRAGDPPVLLADPTKAKQVLGWQPVHSLEDMILHAYACTML
jgi:UDP-glucose 4-epimerase